MSNIETPIEESSFSRFNVKANKKIHKTLVEQHKKDAAYIAVLEGVLKEKEIEIPEMPDEVKKDVRGRDRALTESLMADGSLTALSKSIERSREHADQYEINVQYRNLTFWNDVPKKTIPTVGSTFRSMFTGGGKKHRVDIIKDLTGRILPKRMTLVMGPPGCGKTTFLKALAGQLIVGSAHLEGAILYNGDAISSGKYLVGKVATYADEKEEHAGTLTVRETMEFAWKMTTGGHHSYGVAKDAASAEILDRSDKDMVQINNTLKILGLYEAADTLVGDETIRGVSGGQKRRVTVGEMLLPPRRIKFLDALSNGLDAATTYDIVQALKLMTETTGMTTVISLLQPAPDVFFSFADVIVMADGQIIYHGATTDVLKYFTDLGYHCPENMDVADYLQEIPTPDGRRFTIGNHTASGDTPPYGTDALVQVWKESAIFKKMVAEMEVEESLKVNQWPEVYREKYAASFWYQFTHSLEREARLLIRNTSFVKGRIIANCVVGAIGGSLFSNLPATDSNSLSGILFFAALYGALSSMSMLSLIFSQRAVFYKHSKSLFCPTYVYVLAQTIVMYPLMILETLLFASIVYWSVGLSADYNGSRYFTFMLVVFVFGLCMSQFFRLLASSLPSALAAQPIAGIVLTLMILFSGFIVPASNIPPGWKWFYYINPIAYVLEGVTVNEFLAPDYDFLSCADAECTVMKRFGNVILDSRGNYTEQVWVWYSVAILIGMYAFFFAMTTLCMMYIRVEPVAPPPIVVDYSVEMENKEADVSTIVEIPYEPVTFAFKDVWYTVKLPKTGEELDLLKGVSGYFEPGTVTALMGSSGAGKTTLLDVLAGRKNTGEVKGAMFINGKPLDQKQFRRTMGYVEQFDSLAPNDTAREAIEFSAALRLPGDTPADIRASWVNSVLVLLELVPLENTLVGTPKSGGMSFEQKKRVSIGVELAANPAILFLDEPTSGLDSRSAQVVIRCIKRVASSGRSIVCTIHQPSTVIFDAFESLLLLQRGGRTVYFGELGQRSSSLVSYFEGLPGVTPKKDGVNPATWMLEVIGAGTSNSATYTATDFHACYRASAICDVNNAQINALCPEDGEGNGSDQGDDASPKDIEMGTMVSTTATAETGEGTVAKKTEASSGVVLSKPQPEFDQKYNATNLVQFKVLMRRTMLSYWRSPDYNFGRMFVNVLLALIFSSTYADQKYSSDVDVISRVALIYITVMFVGVIGMNSVQPVIFAERPAFYREQFSNIYDVKLYTLAATLIEVPYLLASSICFLVPYFFIVGFDAGGTTVKFMWYWLFMALHMTGLVYAGHFLAAVLPNEETATVLSGVLSTCISLFCGFMIQPSNFPDFWIFMYWLNPMHYTLEGLISTQFKGDHTMISITGSNEVMTAQGFVSSFYSDWRYITRGYDIMALCIFIVIIRIATYLCFKYVRHDKR